MRDGEEQRTNFEKHISDLSARLEASNLSLKEKESLLQENLNLVEEQKKVIVDLNARVDVYRKANADRSELLELEQKNAKWQNDHLELVEKYKSLELDFQAISMKSTQQARILEEERRAAKRQLESLRSELESKIWFSGRDVSLFER